jgi:hypothetical protein
MPTTTTSSFVEALLLGDIPLEECPICLERFALSMVNKSATIPCCGGGEAEEEEETQEENKIIDLETQQTNNDHDHETHSIQFRLAKERLFIPNCRHQFCRKCLICHCRYSISIKAIPIVCPEASAHCHCATVLPDDLVKDLFRRRWTSSPKNTTTGTSTTNIVSPATKPVTALHLTEFLRRFSYQHLVVPGSTMVVIFDLPPPRPPDNSGGIPLPSIHEDRMYIGKLMYHSAALV